MRNYKCLTTSKFISNAFHLEPIREMDKYEIMTIRNEQLYHLRQAKPLTIEDQENYFLTTITNLFLQDFPNQLLFSFFHNNIFVGYGGLVHINWVDKNAEISFVMKTELEKENFDLYWSNYLFLLEKIAFQELKFHKIFTYAFDIRPHLYKVLIQCNYLEEARLKEHCYFQKKYIDVVIHSKINNDIYFNKPTIQDAKLYFDWANEESVRSNSYNTGTISYESHVNWFKNKLEDKKCSMYLFENTENEKLGQVRIQITDESSAIIGISIDPSQRGKGFASQILEIATFDFAIRNPGVTINAYIKEGNMASVKGFEKAGFTLLQKTNYENIPSFHYIKKQK